jgi:hypothetical protein
LALLRVVWVVVPPSELVKVSLNWRVTLCLVGYTNKKTGYTRGGTTSQSKNEEDENWFVRPDGTKVSIVPKPLVQVPGAKPAEAGAEDVTRVTDAEKGKSKCLKFKYIRFQSLK